MLLEQIILKFILYVDKHDYFNYVAIQGIPKTKRCEKIATKIVCSVFKKKIFSNITLNTWISDDTLMIRYATDKQEMSLLLETIKGEIDLPQNNKERSLLYK